MNVIGQALLAGLNIVTFPTPSAPRFKFGYYWVMAANFGQIAIVLVIFYMHRRDIMDERLQVLNGEVIDAEMRIDGEAHGKGEIDIDVKQQDMKWFSPT